MSNTAVILIILAGLSYAQHPMIASDTRPLRNDGRNTRVIFPGWEPNNNYHNVPVFPEDHHQPREQAAALPAFDDRPQRDSGQPHNSKAEIPDSLNLAELSVSSLQMLSSMKNLSAIADFFGLDPEPIEEPIFEASLSRGGHSEISLRGRSGPASEPAEDAQFAACTPQLETVELKTPPDTLYLPPCVSLERCGGCCAGADLLSCQPTATTDVALKVLKIAKEPSMGFSRAGRRRPSRQTNYHIVHEKRHKSCTCQCIIQEKDCDLNIHVYKATDCACVCKNRDEESKCRSNSATHDWNSKTCKCKCRKVRECSTGEYFDHNTCRCIRTRLRGGYSTSSGGRIIETKDVQRSSNSKRNHRNGRRKLERVPLA
ncbi:unnamed protein product [Meganyctiphanes norvegica]|uniref:Platelet-derived growth factor (PDGF) family profile domain-containing protein n=1 Tax=Meganyctiphanes norvegica TaxID=48144 RepID=A0AAV2PMC0_MEGNR